MSYSSQINIDKTAYLEGFMKYLVEEIAKGESDCALILTVIGDEYRKKIERIALPNFLHYCRRHGIGLLLLNGYLNSDDKDSYPYNIDPGYQRLIAPSLVAELFPQYKYLCDLDADCVPSLTGRNIFANSNLKRGVINLVMPTPNGASRQSLGRRISLLRRFFHKADFPLDSLLAGNDENEKELLGFNFVGPISTLGTCIGHIDDLAASGASLYELIATEFSGYLQNYRNQHYVKNFEVHYLPYEFQAIWNYELALYYPFLYFGDDRDLAVDCVSATMSRVDMLHFAGAWPENNVFGAGPFLFEGSGEDYYKQIQTYQAEKLVVKPYGRIKFKP